MAKFSKISHNVTKDNSERRSVLANDIILNEISEIIVKYREDGEDFSPQDIYNEWSNMTLHHEAYDLTTVIWLLDFIHDLKDVNLEMLKEAVKLDKRSAS